MSRRRSPAAAASIALCLGIVVPGTLGPSGAGAEVTCTDTWTSAAVLGDWSDPTGWADGTVPTADDHVCFPNASRIVQVTGPAVAASVTIGTAGGDAQPRLLVDQDSGSSATLEVNGPIVVHGTLELDGDGDTSVSASSISVPGQLVIDTGGARTLAGAVDVPAGGLLRSFGGFVQGVTELSSAGQVDILGGGALFAPTPITVTGGLVRLFGGLSSVVLEGGRLEGDGNIAGTLTNHGGTIDPSDGGGVEGPVGSITVSQGFTQTGGVLHVDVLGIGAGQHDRVTTETTASVSGTVDVSALGLPVPDVIVVSGQWLDLNVPYAVTGVPDSWVTRTLGQLRVEATPFRSDVPLDHPFVLDIAWSVGDEVMVGYDDGTWRPGASMTRQAVAAVLYRMAGSPRGAAPTCGSMPFPDVLVDHAFCGEIDWAGDEGLLRGYADGTFRPTHPATRQALVASLYRLGGQPLGAEPTCEVAPFPDVPVTHPFCGELSWAQQTGLVEGYGDGTARPEAGLSRQATAALLHRYDLLPPSAFEPPVTTGA